jgi:hypothetical protein
MTNISNRFANLKTWTLTKKNENSDAHSHLLKGCLTFECGACNYNDIVLSSTPYSHTAHAEFSGRLLIGLCLAALVIFNIDALQAVPLDTLREPMKAMKKEVWSYMYVVKVAAALVGGVMSVVQQNLMPMGVGGGIAAGIHFFDEVIGDGAAALIG